MRAQYIGRVVLFITFFILAAGVAVPLAEQMQSRVVLRLDLPAEQAPDTGPAWWRDALHQGGILDAGGWQVASHQVPATFALRLDRTAELPSELVLDLWYQATTAHQVAVQLQDEMGAPLAHIATLSGEGEGASFAQVRLPLGAYPAATSIALVVEVTESPFTLLAASLYEDRDGDGLDAAEEQTWGTSDRLADTDGDGVADPAELEFKTDPLQSDSDGDGFSDGEELYELDKSPLVPMWRDGGIAGRLQGERWNGVVGYTLADLKQAPVFGNPPDALFSVTTSEYAPEGLDDGEHYGIRLRGTIRAPQTGTYSFRLTGDCAAEVWLSEDESPYTRRQRLAVYAYTGFRNLEHPTVPVAELELQADQAYYVEILLKEDTVDEHVTLWWTRPGSVTPEIIPAQYLHSYVQPADDSDGDGLPYNGDPAPLDGTGGGYLDSDADGFSDHQELNLLHMSPRSAFYEQAMPGVLQVERWHHIEGQTTQDLKAHPRFGGVPESATLITATEYAPAGLQAGDQYGVRIRGTLFPPETGRYTFQLTGDADGEFWLSDDATPFARRKQLELAGWTGFRELDNRLVPSIELELQAGEPRYFELLLKEDRFFEHLTLWWTRPGAEEPESIGAEHIASYQQPMDDRDRDGMADAVEVAAGLDPDDGTGGGYRDTDGDGFSDHEEVHLMGTSPTVSFWQASIPGVWQVERWNDIQGARVEDLIQAASFGGPSHASLLVSSTEYAPEKLNGGDNYGVRMRGIIRAPEDGLYRFELTGDADAQCWLSDTHSPYQRSLFLSLGSWTEFRNAAQSAQAHIELRAGEQRYVELLLKEDVYLEHVTLQWVRPSQSEPEVIGSEYISSYQQPADDRDADGLPDPWERAHDLDSDDGRGGGYGDADGDGYADIIEFRHNLDPQQADSDGEGLSDGEELFVTQTDATKVDSDGDGIADLQTVFSLDGADFSEHFDAHISAVWSTSGGVAVVSKPYADPWVAYPIEIKEPGIYRVAVEGESLSGWYPVRVVAEIDDVEVAEVSLNRAEALSAYTFYTPWLSAGSHRLKLTLRCPYWEALPFHLHAVHIGKIDGITDWQAARLDEEIDSDNDGISDADEISQGTDVLRADSDGDGLSDGDELALGTDIWNADSDGDGVLDGVEVYQSRTDPRRAEFDGTVEKVLVLSGASFTTNYFGEALREEEAVRLYPLRSALVYDVEVEQADLLRLNLTAELQLPSGARRPDESFVDVRLDGLYVGSVSLAGDNEPQLFLPWLTPGTHRLELFWDNYDEQAQLVLHEIALEHLGGPDADGSGRRDWVESYLEAVTGMDAPRRSLVSPACIEGNAQYVPLMQLHDREGEALRVKQGAGAHWFANLPLEAAGITEATVTYQNGARSEVLSLEWIPLNLIEHNGETFRIRRGDHLKLVALPIGAQRGAFDIGYRLNVNGEEWHAVDTTAQVVAFHEAGQCTISGSYTLNGVEETASISVEVVEGDLFSITPALMPLRTRSWSPSLPENVVIEAGDSIEVSSREDGLRLHASQTLGAHALVARLGDGGLILDQTPLDIGWVGASLSGYADIVGRYEDMHIWQFKLVAKQLPEEVRVVVETIVAGAVFADDFSLSRTYTRADFNAAGELRFELALPADVNHSACHIVKLYQGDELLGTAYSAAEFKPGM